MKKLTGIVLLFFIIILVSTRCSKDDFLNREYYKYVVYLLSQGNFNILNRTFEYNDGEKVKEYFSIGCGGSQANPESFDIELEKDNLLLNKYNKSNFDIETTKYAKELPSNRYELEATKIKFPAKNSDQYVKVGISVLPDGLSPDSTYFIPVAIKSISRYELNPDKKSVLIRINLKNYYADRSTYYQVRGNILDNNGVAIGTLATAKWVKPLAKSKIRFFIGGLSQSSGSTVDDITKNSIVVTIGDDKKVKIEPYGTIQIEQFPGDETWNTYQEVKTTAEGTKMDKYIYLYYRYRTVKTPATETTPAEYNNWVNVKEIMKRLE